MYSTINFILHLIQMENKDEIIRIQKDSITISQSQLEDLHKTLQEKVLVRFYFCYETVFSNSIHAIYASCKYYFQIHAQEKVITECEKEKRQLSKEVRYIY